jgi:hypothetical protein
LKNRQPLVKGYLETCQGLGRGVIGAHGMGRGAWPSVLTARKT